MKNPLRSIQTPYIYAQTLLDLFFDYRKPRECILRLVKNNELIRLKNGFYLITNNIKSGSNTAAPYEQVANLLYGPSYVSLEWALSFYAMIPERVHTVTSMTLGRNKTFHTPVGEFAYYALPNRCYPVGITFKDVVGFVGGFLIATPEKALADLVFKYCRKLDKTQLKIELLESRRIDEETIKHLDKNLLEEIRQSYNTKCINFLVDLVCDL